MFAPDVLAAVAAAFLLAGFVKGVIGLGLPIISIAVLAAILGLKTAIGLFLIPALGTNIWQAVSGGNFKPLVVRLWPMLLAAVIGIWFGVKILALAPDAWMIIGMGGVLVVYGLIGLTRAQMPTPGRWEVVLSPIIGGVGGVMFGMLGNFMVPGVLYIQALGLKRDMFVQALGITFWVISLTLLFSLSQNALMSYEMLLVSTGALVPTGIGVFVGQRYRKSLSEVQFRKLVFVAVGVIGVYMMVRGGLGVHG